MLVYVRSDLPPHRRSTICLGAGLVFYVESVKALSYSLVWLRLILQVNEAEGRPMRDTLQEEESMSPLLMLSSARGVAHSRNFFPLRGHSMSRSNRC